MLVGLLRYFYSHSPTHLPRIDLLQIVRLECSGTDSTFQVSRYQQLNTGIPRMSDAPGIKLISRLTMKTALRSKDMMQNEQHVIT